MNVQEEIDLPSSILDKAIGAHVRKLRDVEGLSLGEMAERMSANGRPMSYGRLGALERGEHKWTTRDQYAAAVALGMGPEGAALLLLPPDSDAADLLAAYLTGGAPAVAIWLSKRIAR